MFGGLRLFFFDLVFIDLARNTKIKGHEMLSNWLVMISRNAANDLKNGQWNNIHCPIKMMKFTEVDNFRYWFWLIGLVGKKEWS